MDTVSPHASRRCSVGHPEVGRCFDDLDGIESQDALVCCSWNVKGLTDLRILELVLHMQKYDIDILCLQETHVCSTSIYEEQGYLVIQSGSDGDARSWAGVGFIVSPRCKRRIKSYKQVSDRICLMKLTVKGGVVGIFSVYASHNLKPLAERFEFFSMLDKEYRRCSANVGKFV